MYIHATMTFVQWIYIYSVQSRIYSLHSLHYFIILKN